MQFTTQLKYIKADFSYGDFHYSFNLQYKISEYIYF